MVLVEGSYCTDVRQDCNRWLDDEALPFARCAEYSHQSRCVGKRVQMRFCIDRREYTPPGEKLPLNQASYDIAVKTCSSLGKRICTDNEWNFACEGEVKLARSMIVVPAVVPTIVTVPTITGSPLGLLKGPSTLFTSVSE